MIDSIFQITTKKVIKSNNIYIIFKFVFKIKNSSDKSYIFVKNKNRYIFIINNYFQGRQ